VINGYTLDLLAELEPIKETANRFREAAIAHLQIMLAVDEFVATTEDARLAVTVVSIVLQWPSTRAA
jgi:hypothetical protein